VSLKLLLKKTFLGGMSEKSPVSVCNPDITSEPELSTFGPFPIMFSLQTDERERAILCMNQGSAPHSRSPAPACTNSGQYKMLKRKKSNKYDPISLPAVRVVTRLSIGCGSGEWMEKLRLTEDVGAGSFCCG